MITSSQSPGFLSRSFRYSTSLLTHPCVAWAMLLLLVVYVLVVGLGLQRILDATAKSIVARIEIQDQALHAQAEIIGELKKVLPAYDSCQ